MYRYIVFHSAQLILQLYRNVTYASEGLQKLDLWLAIMVIDQKGILIVPSLFLQGTLVFVISWKRPINSVLTMI